MQTSTLRLTDEAREGLTYNLCRGLASDYVAERVRYEQGAINLATRTEAFDLFARHAGYTAGTYGYRSNEVLEASLQAAAIRAAQQAEVFEFSAPSLARQYRAQYAEALKAARPFRDLRMERGEGPLPLGLVERLKP